MEGAWGRSGGPNTAQQLRAAIRELLQLRQFRTATRLLETCRIEEKGDVRSLWYEVHYMKLKEQLGKDSLTSVQRFRCRKRNPPPRHLCPEEIKTRNLPAEARQFLRAWAEGNNISPSVSEREQLIKETGLGKQQIYNWFANYRRRQKRISSQQERDFTRTTICHKRARKLLRRCPQEFSSAGGDTSADVPHDVKEEQAEDEQSRDTDYTAAQQPALSRLQCCCLGLSCHHLLLPEADPVTLLNTTASSYWCRSPEALDTVARTNMALCPCLSTTADLTRPSPVMHPSQPAYPDGLIQYTLSGSKFERVSNLEQFYLTEELLNQDGLSLFSSSEKWQVPLPIFPNNASQFHSSTDSFLSSGQSSVIWAQQKEELIPDGHLQRCLLMCPVDPGYSVLDASQIQPVGSINDAPVLDEGMVTARAGYNALDTVKSAAKTEQVLCAVAGDEDETSRWIEREGLNLPSQWTLGAVCLDAGPQNRDEHFEIDCRGFTHLKVETDENSSPEHSQIQQDAELDIAAQALIQLSQRPAGDPSRVKP